MLKTAREMKGHRQWQKQSVGLKHRAEPKAKQELGMFWSEMGTFVKRNHTGFGVLVKNLA